MDREGKKKALREYNAIIERIDNLTDEYLREFTQATKIVSCADGMPHGNGKNSKVENKATKLIEIKQKLEKEIEKKLIIDKALEELSLPYRKIIQRVDIGGLSLHRYSIEINRTYRNIIYRHNKALDNLHL